MTEPAWQKYYPTVLRFVKSRLADPNEAADLTQEVFIKAYTRQDTLQDPSRIQSWLMQIAQRTIIDYFRKRTPLNVEVFDLADNATSGYNYYDEPCMQACVQYLFEQLPEHHRMILELSDIQQVPQRIMAEQLGIPYPTVKSRVQRARAHTRKLLTECCVFVTDRYGNILDIRPKTNKKATMHQQAISEKCLIRLDT
jgi:RNA polymerase sigma-70 factor, ECF subfamily